MEQPGALHSKPASIKIVSKPSSTACFETSPDPGTTMALLMDDEIFFPFKIFAASLRSSMREFVHEPIKT